MDAIKNDVIQLIDKELTAANSKFPMFSSPHEGYAVMLEEYDETEDELKLCRNMFSLLWEDVKSNNYKGQANKAANIREYAMRTAVEAIQLSAMAQKFIDSYTQQEAL